MIYIDVVRLGLYIFMIVLGVLDLLGLPGVAPWWIAPALILYDIRYPVLMTLPWKRKELQKLLEAQRKSMLNQMISIGGVNERDS